VSEQTWLLQRFREGQAIHSIAEQYGLVHGDVYKFVKSRGVRRNRQCLTEEIKDVIIRDFMNGAEVNRLVEQHCGRLTPGAVRGFVALLVADEKLTGDGGHV
jgi:hypothetical protein